MKKAVILFVVLALAVASLAAFAAEDTAAERFCGRWQDPVYGRAVLLIVPDAQAYAYAREERFDITIRWGSSADSEGIWTMSARYDPDGDALVYKNGKMTVVTYVQGGGIASEEVKWDDAEGRFTWAEGKLLWADSREERSAEFALSPLDRLAPTADVIRDRLFDPVAGWAPGTAGSSLKIAGVCAGVMGFADEYNMWNADVPALRKNLLDAWSALDEEAKARFDENLPGVEAFVETVVTDYDSVAGQFEDAGVGFMTWMAQDRECRMSWDALMYFIRDMRNGA